MHIAFQVGKSQAKQNNTQNLGFLSDVALQSTTDGDSFVPLLALVVLMGFVVCLCSFENMCLFD
jgi:hypothetical protein